MSRHITLFLHEWIETAFNEILSGPPSNFISDFSAPRNEVRDSNPAPELRGRRVRDDEGVRQYCSTSRSGGAAKVEASPHN